MEDIITDVLSHLPFFHRIDSLDELARSLRVIAPGATPEQSTNLMMSGQAFCQSFADLLSASDPAGRVEGSAESRQGILRGRFKSQRNWTPSFTFCQFVAATKSRKQQCSTTGE